MTASLPPRSSLPPPVLPPAVVAQTRIKALLSDLEGEHEPRLRAALLYEIGALTESRLHDPHAARARYEQAAREWPSFRPPLFSLVRLARDTGAHTELAQRLAELARVSPSASERAAVWVELACVQEDLLGDPEAARVSYEQARTEDPADKALGLMLERQLRSIGSADEVREVVALRAAHALDPVLQSELLWECASALANQGHVDDALAALARAAERPARRAISLLRAFRLARRHGRNTASAQAACELAELLVEGAAAPRDNTDTQADADTQNAQAATRFAEAAWPSPESAEHWAAFLYREAGRLWSLEDAPERSTAAYARAAALLPDDVAVLLERLSACMHDGELESAGAIALGLTDAARGQRAAALQFQLAEIAQRKGDPTEARRRLEAALEADPDSPAVLAVLQDALLDAGEIAELCSHLEARAARAQGPDRVALLTRVAALACDPGQDPARGIGAYRALASAGLLDTTLARQHYGAALRAEDPAAVAQACVELLTHPLEDDERSALMRVRYEALLAARDGEGAERALREALAAPTCDAWSGPCASVVAALRRDYALLAQAHGHMAERAPDVELAAAHLCARGRALTRQGDHDGACSCLRRALAFVPGHPYAVALLEELLLARGAAHEAVALLREAAGVEQNARRSELALLHAGAAAEAAGDFALAARSYQEAAEREPLAVSPRWALLRLGERAGDRTLQLRAQQQLAALEDAAARPGVAQLELAEHYDLLGEGELASEACAKALESDSVAFEAAFTASLSPPGAAADEALRPRALTHLCESLPPGPRVHFERERIADALQAAPDVARALLADLQERVAPEASDALHRLLLGRSAAERAHAFLQLAELDADPASGASLALHALNIASFVGLRQDALMVSAALQRVQAGDSDLALALTPEPAWTSASDASTRIRALRARVQHAPAELRASWSFALACALSADGQATQAAALARELLHEDPRDMSAWELLRVCARAAGEPHDVVRACDALAQHAEGTFQALLLEEAAELLEDELGLPLEAQARLRAALAADETRVASFGRLHDLLVDQQDLAGLISLLRDRIRVAQTELERVELLYEQARALRAQDARAAALACAGEVLRAQPEHAGALGLCAEIHARDGDFVQAVEHLRALTRIDIPEGQKRLSHLGAADFLERNLKDFAGAHAELAAVRALGKADGALLARMAELAERADLLEAAVQDLQQAARHVRGPKHAALQLRAGRLLSGLAREDAAAQAFTAALAADPTDIEACVELAALTRDPDTLAHLLERFTEDVLGALAQDPLSVPQLRALSRVSKLRGDATLDRLAHGVLVAFGLAREDEIREHARLLEACSDAPHAVLDVAWIDALLMPAPSPQALRAARMACKAWLDARADGAAKHGLARSQRVRKLLEHPAGAQLLAFARSFGLSVSELYVGGADPEGVTMLRTPGHSQAWVLGPDVRELRARERIRVGQQCAAMSAQLWPLALERRTDARDLLHAALLLARADVAVPEHERLRPLTEELERQLSRGQRRELEAAIAAIPEPLRAFDDLIDAARALAARAALLASQDLALVLAGAHAGRPDAPTLASSPAALSLARFWLSPAFATHSRALEAAP